MEGARQNEARAGNEVAFSQHDVRSEIVSGPTLEQRGHGGTKLVEESTQLEALLRVERAISHAAGVYGRFGCQPVYFASLRSPDEPGRRAF